jgi:hypothetical protein
MMAGAQPPTPPTTTVPTTQPKNKRIDWLRRKYNMTAEYHPVNEKTLDDFIERVYNMVDGKKRIFAISPCIDKPEQVKHAVNWLQKGWCHYFIPEIYQHPQDFQASLDGWISQNTAAGKKPLIIPAIYSGAVEKPDSTDQLWPASDIEEEVDYARSQGVGQVFYSWRVLKEHKHGGPPDGDNIGDHFKAKQYKEKSLIPPGKAPAGDVPTPTVAAGSPGHVKVTPGSGIRIRQWAYKTFGQNGWSGWQTAPGKDTTLRIGNATKVKVRAIDRHNRQSPEVEYP